MKILLAIPDRAEREVLRRVLQDLGYSPVDLLAVTTAGEALEAVRTAEPAVGLLVADWNLPGGEGAGLLRGLKKLPGGREIAVLHLAAPRDRKSAGGALDWDLEEMLERPFTPEGFREKIRHLEGEIETRHIRELSRRRGGTPPPVRSREDLPFFLRIPSAAMKEFLATAVQATYDPGTTVISAGEKVEFFHLVTAGTCDEAGQLRGTGDSLGATAFLAERPQGAAVVARTKLRVSTLSRPRLAEFLQRHPAVERVLADLLDPADLPPKSTTDSEFRGARGAVLFTEVIQVLQRSRETGTLLVASDSGRGGVTIRQGEVRHAWAGNRTGEEAFQAIARWKSPTFSFTSGTPVAGETITRTTMSLVMQAAAE